MQQTMENKKPVKNPSVVLREEFDDWAVLFNPENGDGFGINPVSVFIWKLLNGKNSTSVIVAKLQKNCDDVPEDAEKYVQEFIDSLVEKGLVGEKA